MDGEAGTPSSEKEWFIYRDNHHRGPYTQAELVEMVDEGGLDLDHLVWKESFTQWQKLRGVWPLYFAESSQPPPLPRELGSHPQLTKTQLPQNEVPQHKVSGENSSLNSPLLPSGSEKGPKNPLLHRARQYQGLIALLVLGVVGASIYFIGANRLIKRLPQPHKYHKKVKASDGEKRSVLSVEGVPPIPKKEVSTPALDPSPSIQKAVKKKKVVAPSSSVPASRPQPSAAAEIKFDGQKGVLSVNLHRPIKVWVEMTFQSLPGRIISSRPERKVVFRVTGRLRHGKRSFKKLRILKGRGVAFGEYQLKVRGKKSALPDWLLKKFPQQVIIGPYNQKKLHQALEDQRVQLWWKKTRPVKEIIERYRTFVSLMDQTHSLFLKEIERISEPAQIENFSLLYSEQLGLILRDLTLGEINPGPLNMGDHKKSDAVVPLFQEELPKLMTFGKAIGQAVIDAIDSVKNAPKLDKKSKTVLSNQFLVRFEALRSSLEARVELLEEKLKKLAPYKKSS